MRSFVDDVREGMTERQEQISQAFAEGELFEDGLDEAQEGNR